MIRFGLLDHLIKNDDGLGLPLDVPVDIRDILNASMLSMRCWGFWGSRWAKASEMRTISWREPTAFSIVADFLVDLPQVIVFPDKGLLMKDHSRVGGGQLAQVRDVPGSSFRSLSPSGRFLHRPGSVRSIKSEIRVGGLVAGVDRINPLRH